MAITLAQTRQVYSARTAAEIDLLPLFPSLLDRSWDTDMLTAGKVRIPNPTYGAAATKYTKGSAWKTATKSTMAYIDIDPDDAFENAVNVDWEDPARLPFDLLEGERAAGAAAISEGIDSVLAQFMYRDNSSITVGSSTFGSSINYPGSRMFSKGSGTNHLNVDGSVTEATAGTVRQFPRQILGEIIQYFVNAKLAGSQARITADGGVELDRSRVQIFAVMPARVMALFQEDLENLGVNLERFNDDLLRNGGVFQSELYRGYWKGIDIFSSPVIPAPTGTDDWRIPVFMRAAVAYSPAGQITNIFDPNTNQSGPQWGIRQLSRFGKALVNPEMAVLGQIESS